ncbi:MAG: hypothetical protein Fues2KO_38440 [Fuerstiella sp.]
MNLLRILSLCCCVVAVGSSTAWAVDVAVRQSDNTTFRGTFTDMGKDAIVVKRTNNEEITLSVADLKSVQFDNEPIELRIARSNERSGALDTALEKLEEVRRQYNNSDKRLATDLEFLVARVKGKIGLVDPAKAAEAEQALQEFRTANPTNFRYLEATLLQAALQIQQDKSEEAKTLLEEVRQSGVVGYQLQAGVDLGRLYLKSGDAAAAESAFDEVISKSSNDPAAATAMYASMLGKATGLQQQNKLDEAIATLDEVIEKAPQGATQTLAEAWLRKGDCLRLKQQSKAALMAYLHVDVLYSGESAQHAEALLRLSELWGPAGHADRAVDASARLAERYPNSPWAKKSGSGS